MSAIGLRCQPSPSVRIVIPATSVSMIFRCSDWATLRVVGSSDSSPCSIEAQPVPDAGEQRGRVGVLGFEGRGELLLRPERVQADGDVGGLALDRIELVLDFVDRGWPRRKIVITRSRSWSLAARFC